MTANAAPPRIEIDREGLPLVVVDEAGAERAVVAWGLAVDERTGAAALVLTKDGKPPTIVEYRAIAETLCPSLAEMAREVVSVQQSLAGETTSLAERTSIGDDVHNLRGRALTAERALMVARDEAQTARMEAARAIDWGNSVENERAAQAARAEEAEARYRAARDDAAHAREVAEAAAEEIEHEREARRALTDTLRHGARASIEHQLAARADALGRARRNLAGGLTLGAIAGAVTTALYARIRGTTGGHG